LGILHSALFILHLNAFRQLTIKQKEPIMTTLVQFVPKWLRVRLQRPTQPKSKTVSKKDRQVLPTLPNTKRPPILFQDGQSPPGHQLRGLT
jgi:hypothetical protein